MSLDMQTYHFLVKSCYWVNVTTVDRISTRNLGLVGIKLRKKHQPLLLRCRDFVLFFYINNLLNWIWNWFRKGLWHEVYFSDWQPRLDVLPVDLFTEYIFIYSQGIRSHRLLPVHSSFYPGLSGAHLSVRNIVPKSPRDPYESSWFYGYSLLRGHRSSPVSSSMLRDIAKYPELITCTPWKNQTRSSQVSSSHNL